VVSSGEGEESSGKWGWSRKWKKGLRRWFRRRKIGTWKP